VVWCGGIKGCDENMLALYMSPSAILLIHFKVIAARNILAYSRVCRKPKMCLDSVLETEPSKNLTFVQMFC